MLERVSSRLGVRDRLGRRSIRAIAAATAALAVLTTVVGAGWNNGYPADKVRLLSGAAWLPSSHEGQLTLLDGSSAEVAAQVQVAEPGNRLSVVQHGTTAYAINHTAGSIRRIDGGTFDITAPVTPIPDAGDGLHAYAGADTLYALDTQHGLLTQTDPKTLASRSGLLPLAAQVRAQAATLDDAGRLWVLDTTTGDVTWIKDGQRDTRRRAIQPGSGMLVLAGSSPVLIDITGRIAVTLDPETGDTEYTTQLDLRPDDTIQVGGSPHAPQLHVVTSRGVLAVCDLTRTSCGDAVPLGDADAKLGPPIETGDRVFVPDYTSGRVWIVDLNEKRVVAQPTVLPPAVHFELLTRDGIVFFNDPDSERAGVLRLDGSVIHVPKYDPKPSAEANKTPTSSPPQNQKSTDDERPPPSTTRSATTPLTPDYAIPAPTNPSSSPGPDRDPESDDDSGPGGGSPSLSPTTDEWGTPIYQDDFNGESLSTADWYIYDDSWNPDKKPPRRPDAVNVQDGELQLIGGFNAEGMDVSGGVASKMDLKYGRWEVRFKVDRGAGYSAAVLLWPERNEDWPAAGEIDFTEIPEGDRTTAHTIVHNGPDNDQVGGVMHADFTQWHRIAVEWTADYVAFYLDGVKQQFTVTDPKMVPNLTPMHLTLQLDQGCDPSWTECRNSQTPRQVVMHVDWVKIYVAP